MVIQYKCPDCGADLFYDAETQKMKCGSCGYTNDITATNDKNGRIDPAALNDNVHEINGDFEDFQEQSTFTTFNSNDAVHYVCRNCGAELITSPEVTATTCSYCDAPMVLGDRLSGCMAPALVVPFTISKQQADEAFTKWRKRGKVTPTEFQQASRVKSLTGMYVPFWLYDANGRGEGHFHATKKRSYRSGDYRITETKHYDVYRKVSINYDKIPVDASKKMPDAMMDNLEPFDYKDLHNFAPAYLSGYISEKYDFTDTELFPRLQQRTNRYTQNFLMSTIKGYSSVTATGTHYETRKRNSYYTLMPVWMFAYQYKGKEYMYVMNGQTGVVVGKPPISVPKVLLRFSVFTIICFLILYIITYFGGTIS